MIKGIKGHGFYDTLVVPIVENTARESELTFALRCAAARAVCLGPSPPDARTRCVPHSEAMEAYPAATAVLVRRHGVYVWGDTWAQAKTQAECYHYLFQAAVEARRLGVRVDTQPSVAPKDAYSNGHQRWLPAGLGSKHN